MPFKLNLTFLEGSIHAEDIFLDGFESVNQNPEPPLRDASKDSKAYADELNKWLAGVFLTSVSFRVLTPAKNDSEADKKAKEPDTQFFYARLHFREGPIKGSPDPKFFAMTNTMRSKWMSYKKPQREWGNDKARELEAIFMPIENGKVKVRLFGLTLSKIDKASKKKVINEEKHFTIFDAPPTDVISAGPLKTLHVGARTKSFRPEDPPRFFVPDNLVSWGTRYDAYRPVAYTSDVVLNAPWAQNKDIHEVEGIENALSFEGAINMSPPCPTCKKGRSGCLPLNPRGRTGWTGRSHLGFWGPTQAADPVVTRLNPSTGKFEVACNERTVGGVNVYSLPGSMVVNLPPTEQLTGALLSSFAKKATNIPNERKRARTVELLKKLFSEGPHMCEVYRGYNDDPRNTDNAWMETTVYHFHCSFELGALLPIEEQPEGDRFKTRWIPIDHNDERYHNLFTSHAKFVDKAMEMWTPERQALQKDISPEDLEDFRVYFDLFDEDRSGYVTKEEFVNAFQVMGLPKLNDEQLEKFMHHVDFDGDGQVSFEEFVLLMKEHGSGQESRLEIAAIFSSLDTSGDGQLSREELSECLEQMGDGIMDPNEQLGPEDIEFVLNLVDEDNDGQINREEFENLMLGDHLTLTQMKQGGGGKRKLSIPGHLKKSDSITPTSMGRVHRTKSTAERAFGILQQEVVN